MSDRWRSTRSVEPSSLTSTSQRANGWAQLDTARLVLASIVAIAHANYIFLTPLGYVTIFPALRSLSYYAVLAFFVVSGMVIGRSLLIRRDGFLRYIQRRFWRIYPPLIATLLFMMLLSSMLDSLGVEKQVAVGAAPLEGGFDLDPRRVLLCLLTFGFRGWLASDANVALWSLAIEMRCYVAIGAATQILLGKTNAIRIASAIFAFWILREIARDPRLIEFAPCYFCFLSGFCLCLICKRLPSILPVVPTDISYSLYIVHFPIMMTTYLVFVQGAAGSTSKSVLLFLATIVGSILVSILSANTIEKIRPRSIDVNRYFQMWLQQFESRS
jgi:peptidoglycan/LPS O-acetylase OafA/YrhL